MEQQHITALNITHEEANSRIRAFMNKVYGWMAFSLLLSAGAAAYAVVDAELMFWVADNYILSLIGSLGILLVMSFASRILSSSALGALFIIFSVVEGLILSPLLSMVAPNTLATALASTAGMFAIMSLYGATTSRNLSGMRTFLMMSLIGLIIASIANIFIGGSMLSFGISVFGVLIFAAFTAYDTQTLRMMALEIDGEDRSKAAVHGALSLYLNFLNMFLYLLRIMNQE